MDRHQGTGYEWTGVKSSEQREEAHGRAKIVFYNDAPHSAYWGREKYTGRAGDDARRQPPIEASKFVRHFFSDGMS